MKLALLSDIHANIQGMDACLAHARANGAKQFALLGDFVGYGADPVAVVQRAQDLASAGAWLIKGNHDELAVNPPAIPRTLGDSTAAWTHAQLSPDQRQFLDSLPMTRQTGSVLLVHASACEPSSWPYVYEEEAAIDCLAAASLMPGIRQVFVGHVHHQTLFSSARDVPIETYDQPPGLPISLVPQKHWLATVGSAGQPRDGNPQAMYTLYDTTTHLLTFQRVTYNHLQAAEAIRAAGLPLWLAQRIEVGR
jgi:diadenosine tetraphosphatase ApaH/serine/threonine PP2A family protein phosphatase